MARKTAKAERDKKNPGKVDLTGWLLEATEHMNKFFGPNMEALILEAATEAIECAARDGAFIRLNYDTKPRTLTLGRIPISLTIPLETDRDDEPQFKFTLEKLINETLDDLSPSEIDNLIEELQWLAARVERWRTALKAQAA